MADASRRKGGATAARSRQDFLQQQMGGATAGTPTGSARGFGGGTPTGRGYVKPSPNARNTGQKGQLPAKMGIKSGMTVEDLKRLTQKRMQQSGGPGTPKSPALTPQTEPGGVSSRPATPKINVAAINASTAASAAAAATPTGGPGTPVLPKMGMTVQELKQLTTLRLASQSAPLRQSQTEITGLVSNAVLSNAAKSQFREGLRGSLTPGAAPRRPTFGSLRAGSNNSNNEVIPVRGNRSRSRSSQIMKTVEPPADTAPARYSYSGQSLEEYLAFDYSHGDGGNSSSSQETDPYAHRSFDDDDGGKPSFEESLSRHSLQFPDDSFPPPPPLDDSGGFVSTALPSWSPPPARAKQLDSTPSIPPSFYNQQTSYYNIASKDDAASQDQNAVIAPPPGLSRRPSMTVPWQVAEAVLNTPQTVTTRKKLASPTSSSNTASEPESAKFDDGGAASSMKSPAAQAAVQLGALTSQIARNRGGSGAPPLATSQPLNAMTGPRRGSFGNAAEFFKFRRRSKSRLELARDFPSAMTGNGDADAAFPNYGAAGTMPGIDETVGDVQEGGARGETVSDASSSTSDNEDDDDGSSSQDYTDEDVVHVTGGYDDMTEISNNFVQFYRASGASGRGLDNASGLPSLSIPPPPPPPMTDDEDDASATSSSKGLPMMSPNGLRLRKVAEMARRGSLSSEDKTRAKDEIIQSSLGISATNAARIFSANMGERSSVPTSSVVPPPGFSAPPPPPRDVKAGAKKTLLPGAGIARGAVAGGVGAGPGRMPATAATPLVASPHGSAGRKTLVEHEAVDNNSSSLEERLAAAAQEVANCVSKGDMVNFQKAMDELDWLRNEANKMMRG